jgi:phosphate-selective porin O/P
LGSLLVKPATSVDKAAGQIPAEAPSAGQTLASNALLKEEREQPYEKQAPKHWYDKISARGYMQFRENNLINPNKNYTCDQCDKSIGPDEGFFLRRMRLVLFGDISDHVSFYLQPDFASSSGSSQNYAQLRDAYFDISFDNEKAHRIRVGQSKIPYGFEIMQSSQNRLDFDRTDAVNSAQQNERDLGIFYYWARPNIRARFAELTSKGLKGSGDYGEFGAGIYNGEGPNNLSVNKYFHTVVRYTYPFKLRNGQFIETSIQGYTGKYTVTNVSSDTTGQRNFLYNDQRLAVSLIVYPQPLGFQAEYNWGTGPQYNSQTKYIDQHALNGGYALLNYRFVFPRNVVLMPYSRFQYYDGGKKFELDARKYHIVEGDFGIEMQLGKSIEITPQYQYGDRLFVDGSKPVNRQLGSLLRLQLQFNF